MSYIILNLQTDGIQKDSSFCSQRPILISYYILNDDIEILKEKFNYISGVNKLSSFHKKLTCDEINKKGKTLYEVMKEFRKEIKDDTKIICHNSNFIFGCLNQFISIKRENFICSMVLSKNLCKIGYSGDYKFPKLTELANFLNVNSKLNNELKEVNILYQCVKKIAILLDIGNYKEQYIILLKNINSYIDKMSKICEKMEKTKIISSLKNLLDYKDIENLYSNYYLYQNLDNKKLIKIYDNFMIDVSIFFEV